MTHTEAYIQNAKLAEIMRSWDRSRRWTKYQKEVSERSAWLYEYSQGRARMPIEEDVWLKKCPPCDVEETAENWFRNNWHFAKDKTLWKRKFDEAGGIIPPLGDVEIPESVLELDRKEAGK